MENYDDSNTFIDSIRSFDDRRSRHEAATVINTHSKAIGTILTDMELSRETLLASAWMGRAADKYSEVSQLWHEDALELQRALTLMSQYLGEDSRGAQVPCSSQKMTMSNLKNNEHTGLIGYDYDAIDSYVMTLEDYAHQLHRERAAIFEATQSVSFDNSLNEELFHRTRIQWNEEYTHLLSTLHRLRRGVDKARQNMLKTQEQIKEMLNQPLSSPQE